MRLIVLWLGHGCRSLQDVTVIIIPYSRGVHGGELARGIAFVDTGASRKSQVVGFQPAGLQSLRTTEALAAPDVLLGSF